MTVAGWLRCFAALQTYKDQAAAFGVPGRGVGARALGRRLARKVKTTREFPNINPAVLLSCRSCLAASASARALARADPGSFFVGMGDGSWLSSGFGGGGGGGCDFDSQGAMWFLRCRMLMGLGSLANACMERRGFLGVLFMSLSADRLVVVLFFTHYTFFGLYPPVCSSSRFFAASALASFGICAPPLPLGLSIPIPLALCPFVWQLPLSF